MLIIEDPFTIDTITVVKIMTVLFLFLLFLYLLPFVASPWIKQTSSLYGYIVGKIKKRKTRKYFSAVSNIETASFPVITINTPVNITQNSTTTSQSNSTNDSKLNVSTPADNTPQSINVFINEICKNENNYLEAKLDKVEKRLNKVLNNVQTEKERLKNFNHEVIENIKDSVLVKDLCESYENVTNELSNKLLFFAVIIGLLVIDTWIGYKIFKELGVFGKKDTIWGIEVNLVLGVFLTVTVTMFLEIFWDYEKIKNIKKNTFGIIIGLTGLLSFAVLRIFSNTVQNKTIFLDIIFMMAWVISIVGIYWSTHQIMGEKENGEENWYDFAVVLFFPLVFVFSLLGLGFSSFTTILEKINEFVIETLFIVPKNRIEKKIQNEQEKVQSIKDGIRSGLQS
jgi:hypothetical protein